MTQRQIKLVENYIRRTVKQFLVEESQNAELEKPFWVIEKGGSIGQSGTRYIGGGIRGRFSSGHDTKEEAAAKAKRMRSYLSPGEKSYYGMGYAVVPANMKNIRD